MSVRTGEPRTTGSYLGFLRRLFGGQQAEPHLRAVITTSGPTDRDGYDPADGPCFVTVGHVTVPGAIYLNNERDIDELTSGIRLEDPRTGRMMFRESDYPQALRDAGARSVAIVGIPHHPDAQRPEFSVGSMVRLVPEPRNVADPQAIAFLSGDRRYLAGYVSREDNPSLRATMQLPAVGLIVWERHTDRPRVRQALIALAGPSVALGVVAPRDVPGEVARRRERYIAGRREEDAEMEAARVAWEDERRRRALERERVQADRIEAREAKVAAKAVATAQASAWRAAGLCVDCGGSIEPSGGRGRPPIRCALHRAGGVGA